MESLQVHFMISVIPDANNLLSLGSFTLVPSVKQTVEALWFATHCYCEVI